MHNTTHPAHDPSVSPDGRWRWDGTQWVPNLHKQPEVVPVVPFVPEPVQSGAPAVAGRALGHEPTGSRYLWWFVIVAGMVGIANAVETSIGTGWAWYAVGGAALVANTVVGVLDERLVKRSGGEAPSSLWAAFLVPVYLWKRCRQGGVSPAPGWTWLATLVASFSVLFYIEPSLSVDAMEDEIATSIASDISDELGTDESGSVEVSCPRGQRYADGDLALCTATRGEDSATVEVEMRNDGYYEWELSEAAFPVFTTAGLETAIADYVTAETEWVAEVTCAPAEAEFSQGDAASCSLRISDDSETLDIEVDRNSSYGFFVTN